jgi:hypothetical protein
MKTRLWILLSGLCGLATLALCTFPSAAQAQEVKPKPPMFSYVADWQVPRANWGDMNKVAAPLEQIMQQGMADGTLVGYGSDVNLVHQPDTETHDNWWSSMSLAGIVKTLDRLRAAEDNSSPVLNASKHWDNIFVSRFYNWKSGSYKNAYTHVGVYKLKEDAPDDAIDSLSEHLMVPLLEKQLADGTIIEYEIDTLAIHTQAPGTFYVVYLTPTPEGLDTVQNAVIDAVKADPLGGQAFGSMTDPSGHRDELDESAGTYK